MGSKKECLMYRYEELLDTAKICLSIKMPDGNTELIINQNAKTKLEYINKAYDDDLRLKANPDIYIVNHMIYS